MLFLEFVNAQWEPAILPTLKYATQRNYRHLARRHLFLSLVTSPCVTLNDNTYKVLSWRRCSDKGSFGKRLFISATCSVRYSPRLWSGSMYKGIRLGVKATAKATSSTGTLPYD